MRRTVVMSGARRTGKTTIIYQTISDLLDEGVKPQNILFFTFDHPVIRAAGIDRVSSVYKENISNDEQFYLFVDEIQFDKEWTHYLKMVYDMNPEMRAVATGSASAAVEDGVRESGAGRWTVIRIPTLSFCEYCQIKELNFNTDCEDVMDRAIKHDLPKIHEIRSIDELEKYLFIFAITVQALSMLRLCVRSLTVFPSQLLRSISNILPMLILSTLVSNLTFNVKRY